MIRNLLLASLLCVCVSSLTAQTVTGDITADESWSGTVTLTGDIHITSGTVTIAAGTEVQMAATNDNVVFGGANTIYIVVSGDGGLVANGTAGNPVTFTSESGTAPGSWGRIQIINNGTNSSFSNCIIEYCTNGIAIQNPTGVTGSSSPAVTGCIIRNGSSTGVYGQDGTNATFTDCQIYDCGNGFFFNGAGSVSFTGCYVYRVACGFILAGTDTDANTVTIDHCTLYGIDMMLSSDPKWWTGYGIFCTNTAGTLTLTNTIMVQSTLANLIGNGWTVTENNNCFYTGMMGLMNYEDGTPDATDIVGDFSTPVDPLFADAAGGDLRIASGSPVLDAGSDGKNMGAYDGPGVADAVYDGYAAAFQAGLPNPVTAATVVPVTGTMDVFTTAGDRIATYRQGSLRGADLAPGLYHYTVTAAGQRHAGSFVVSK